ncbi:hypothetical protein [Roseicella frigidaeris]|uniref:hypothetical protein n=1 Tax=Roseicella frigidaeris TaxID=2230885 RepID=UPI001402F5F8|nr:hypothetical protein [Roseicella frigidaeris]
MLRTDDAGTLLLDGEGRVAGEHGTDRHAMLLAELGDAGWQVTADGHRVPPGGPAEPPGAVAGDTGAPGLRATETDAESG